MSRFNRIDLKMSGHYDEKLADGAITPGMRVQLDADGKVTIAATQGLLGPVRLAMEDALQGNTVSDDYAADELVFICEPKIGDVVAVLVETAVTLVIGDKLIVDVDGKYIKTTGTPAQVDFESLEAITTSGAQLVKVKRI